jgi:mannose-6-phosphate isomerase
MTIEHANIKAVPKPWGVADLRPWREARHDGIMIGEILYERPGRANTDPSLLLKLLFTNQPLSIQVHPDDAFAQSIGLPSGKTEAWYVLSASPEAKVALGLTQRLTPPQLREAICDGSIADLVLWQTVLPGDVIFVPAGTIHAIGAGLVVAEIQQRSDVTFRLFDYGRERGLHIESAISVADAGPADLQCIQSRLSDSRTLLISSAHFVLERIDLAPNSAWRLEAERETWLLALSGSAVAGSIDISTGDAVFAQSDCLDLRAGATGMVGLTAYTGVDPVPHLLRRLTEQGAMTARRPWEVQAPLTLLPETAAPTSGQLESNS